MNRGGTRGRTLRPPAHAFTPRVLVRSQTAKEGLTIPNRKMQMRVEQKAAKTTKKTGPFDSALGFFSLLLILLPATFGVLYVHTFGVSVVDSDAWSVVPLFDKWFSGTLQVSDLWSQHNAHRPFFPNIAYIILGVLTEYNNVAEMYLIQACFFVTLVVLLLAFIDNIRFRPSWLFLFVPVALLIFSLRQYKNMLNGYQINFAFTEMFGILALFLLYLLVRRESFRKLAFAGALASATVAACSILAGLMVWPAGLLQLFLSPSERSQKRVYTILWGLSGILVWVVYFIGWDAPGKGTLLHAIQHPLRGMHYYTNLLGSSLFWKPDSALLGGLLLICLALVSLLLIYKDGRLGEYRFWVSLLLYSMLILGSIMVGNSELGVNQAVTAKRYTTFPILAVVALYAMLAKTALERRSIPNTVLLVALSGVILLSTSISYREGIKRGKEERADNEELAYVLYTYESQSDDALSELMRRTDVVRKQAPTLQRLGYNVFSEESQAPREEPDR